MLLFCFSTGVFPDLERVLQVSKQRHAAGLLSKCQLLLSYHLLHPDIFRAQTQLSFLCCANDYGSHSSGM